MHLIELNKVYDMSVKKKDVTWYNEYFESITKVSKKKEIKKSVQNFFMSKYKI